MKNFPNLSLAGFNPNYIHTVSLAELYEKAFESQPAVIENFLYSGLYVLAGDPKIGKSFLVAQIAFHVACGKDFWGMKTTQGSVMYLALEDHYPRIQKRMYKMFDDENSDKLFFAVNAKLLGSGLEEQLDDFITHHPDCNLIIIDTLQKIRGNGNENYSYANDYSIMTKLKSFADNHRICVVLVHHTRKLQSEDPFGKISGTSGIMGAADGAIILTKESRQSLNATLEVSGRDQQDIKFNITKDPKTMLWNLVDTETELWKEAPEPLILKLAEKIKSVGEWSGTPTELVEFLGEEIKPNSLSMKLNINSSKLFHDYGIHYENSRNHDGRKINLSVCVTENEICDDTSAAAKTPSPSSHIVTGGESR